MKGTRIFLRCFTNQGNFFDLFEKQVGHAVEAARFFQEVAAQNQVTEEMLSQMAQIEHQGDNAAHTIIGGCESNGQSHERRAGSPRVERGYGQGHGQGDQADRRGRRSGGITAVDLCDCHVAPARRTERPGY